MILSNVGLEVAYKLPFVRKPLNLKCVYLIAFSSEKRPRGTSDTLLKRHPFPPYLFLITSIHYNI